MKSLTFFASVFGIGKFTEVQIEKIEKIEKIKNSSKEKGAE